jgi:hypothetical protein
VFGLPIYKKCEKCDKIYPARRNEALSGRSKYCSKACKFAAQNGVLRSESTRQKLSDAHKFRGAVSYSIHESIVKIPLTQNKIALIDEIDVDLAKLKWFAWGTDYSYAARRIYKIGCVYLHRLVLGRKLGTPMGQEDFVDHINHNTLDNRRANLRLATKGQNCHNQKKRNACGSKFKGLTKCSNGTWKVSITINYNRIHLGYFSDEILAARAYDAAARKYFGEFAKTNFEEGGQLQKTLPTY